MKSKNVVLANLLLMVAGGLLIVFHRHDILSMLVVVMGVVFVVPSVVSLVQIVSKGRGRRGGRRRVSVARSVLVSLGALGLGLLMIVNPLSLIGVVVYLFAALLVFAGLYDVVMLSVGYGKTRAAWWLYLLPSLMAIAGIVILVTDVKSIESIVVLVTGISIVAYALNRFMEFALMGIYTDSENVAESPVN